ncbi:class I SAM-dependent methyltransferase [Candidatus Saccharibacteria bacterium]|nr:class I SAM-dependent methyltransferase [Candidatus Saccharibacteria bacterium]
MEDCQQNSQSEAKARKAKVSQKMSNYSDSFFDESNQNSSWYKVFEMIPPKSKLLDVGCSSGNFGEVLINKKNCLVDGVEPDARDAKVATSKLNKVWTLNIETDDLSDLKNNYDFIYFGDVIEHLVNPIGTLTRIKPLLSKTGAVIFSIPNMGHVGVRLALLKGEFEYTETGLTDKTHLHFYTMDEVQRVFAEAGYKIDKMDFVKKDYPKDVLKKYLNELGLIASPDFFKRMSQPDASAFQFVGLARPAAARRSKLKRFGPIDLFESLHEDTKKNYEAQINQLKSELEEAKNLLKHKSQHPYRAAAGHFRKKLKKT